jgi:serine/threonine-protein kinase
LCHPNIVDVYSFGRLPDGRPYYVMELLRGQSLWDRVAEGPLPLAPALAILEQVARALKVTHAAGIVHRDLKPDNIFLVGDDDAPHVKLLDFGLAMLLHPDRAQESGVVGTPLYMSPEQARGRPVDARSDIYSLGAVAFEMLVGSLPFAASGAVQMLHLRVQTRAPRASTLRPDVPPALDRLLVEMLSHDPEARPPIEHVLAVASALRAQPFAPAGPPTAPMGVIESAPPPAPRRRNWLARIASFFKLL